MAAKHWVIALVVALSGFGLGRIIAPQTDTATLASEVINFELVDTEGNSVTPNDWRGSAALVFFGYTYCPDVCPTSLADMRMVKQALSDQDASRFKGVFITIDPARDTPEQLKRYVHHFDPRFLALSGSESQLQTAAQTLGAVFSRGDDLEGGGYLMNHSAFGHLLAPDGQVAAVFPVDAPLNDVIEGVRAALRVPH